MSTSRLCAAALAACVTCLVGCDHATKLAAESILRDRPAVAVVPGVLDLSYTENRDVAFDALARLSLHPASWVIVAFGLVASALLVVLWMRRRRDAWPVHAGFACVLAGAAGNVIDRAARGHVIDFIHLRYWPVFNVADVLVVVGALLLLRAWPLSRRRPLPG